MNWIKPGTTLIGEHVELVPLEKKHFPELINVASDKRIWEFTTADMSTSDNCWKVFAKAIIERDAETQFPFVIYHNRDKRIIGSTRLMNIEPAHRKLEIGFTWLHPDYWATVVNPECKFLLLRFCFEELKAIRVQLKADENNIRSRKAIEKIGGRLEGILRRDLIRENGTIRTTAYFSIIDNEWPSVKTGLINQVGNKNEKIVAEPIIKFDDFIVRELTTDDAVSYCDYVLKNKNRIASSAPVTTNAVTDVETARTFILNRIDLAKRKELFTFILFNSDNKPVSTLIIKNIDWSIPKGEIGYHTDGDYLNKGITTCFVKHICEYAFGKMGFNKLFMRIGSENAGSRRIAEKNNFIPEGLMRQDFRNFNNELVDVNYYSKLKTGE